MTASEIREACERLLRHQMFRSECDHLWNCHQQCQWCHSMQRDVDIAAVAAAWLSEHPATEPETINYAE